MLTTFARAKIVPVVFAVTCILAGPAPTLAKPKTLPWDLQIKADVFMITKLPEYLALARVCARADADTSAPARITANYAKLYAKSQEEADKLVAQGVENAAMNHGRDCAPADSARFKALYPYVEEMDGFLSTAVKEEAARASETPKQ